MNYPCDIIRDLLPLYHDGVTSEESRRAVEGHLNECADCRAFYEKLRGGDYMDKYLYDAELSKKAAESYQSVQKKSKRKIFLIVGAVALGILLTTVLPMALILVMVIGISASAEVEVHDDVSEYTRLIGTQAEGQFQDKWGMDESIFPAQITPEMDVQDFRMVYYDPWDKQFLGYLIVHYDAEAYAAERARLEAYPSTDYIGYYSVKEETTYELLAVNADPYQGFVYALTDGEGTVIYAEQIFCNYQMDIDYGDYMHGEFFLDGFDARTNNPYQKEQMGEQ